MFVCIFNYVKQFKKQSYEKHVRVNARLCHDGHSLLN